MDEDLVRDLASKPILHWNARNFTEMPVEILHFGQHTEEIYLRWNNICVLPSWMGITLGSLTNLYLEFNKLSDLPSELSQLKNLHTLHLDSNNFSKIPKAIFRLCNLRCLKMSRNLIEYLDTEIRCLTHLEVLDLSHNMMKLIPQEISQCHELQELYLNNNDIMFLPRVMTRMRKLSTIDISSNLLHLLPATKFLSQPVINIGNNSKLNWASIQALQQYLTNVNLSQNSPTINLANRCEDWMITQTNDGSQVIETECDGFRQKLFLPRGLEVCSMKVARVPTLLELAARRVSGMMERLPDDQMMEVDGVPPITLPKGVQNSLEQGPLAICHVCSCPIFRHSYCALTHTNIVQIPHCVLIFCSRSCAITYYAS